MFSMRNSNGYFINVVVVVRSQSECLNVTPLGHTVHWPTAIRVKKHTGCCQFSLVSLDG